MFSTKTRVAALAGAAAVIGISWAITATASGPAPLPQDEPVHIIGRLSGSMAVQYHNLDDLRMASTSVARVTAVSRKTVTSAEQPPHTLVEVNVAKVLSGTPLPPKVTVYQPGGPQFVMDYPWSKIMIPGREYVLFLADLRAPGGVYALTGGAYELQAGGAFTLHEPDLLPATATLEQLREVTPVSALAPATPKLIGCPSGTRAGKVPPASGASQTARQILDAIGATPGDRRPGVTVDGWQVYTVFGEEDKPIAAYVFRLHSSGAGAVLVATATCAH